MKRKDVCNWRPGASTACSTKLQKFYFHHAKEQGITLKTDICGCHAVWDRKEHRGKVLSNLTLFVIFLFHFSFQIFGFQDEDSLIMTFGAKSGCATGSKLTPSGKNHSFGSQCLMTRSKYICCKVFNSHNNGKKL